MTNQTNPENELTDVESRIFHSILSLNPSALLTLIADDFTGIGFAGQHVGKEAYAKIHTNTDSPFTKYDITHENITVTDELAFISGIQDVTAGIHLKSYFISIYKKVEGNWLLFYWQETGIVDPKIFSS